jgi:RimJ/RimL family protein N-acetyltransferase
LNRLVYDQDARLIEWACTRPNHQSFAPGSRAIGLEAPDGRILAAFIYDTFTTRQCFMHVASDGAKRWASRRFLFHAFAYPFLTCGLARIAAPISERNTSTVRLAEKLGLTREGVWRKCGPDGEDMILFGMLESECRWLRSVGGGNLSPGTLFQAKFAAARRTA